MPPKWTSGGGSGGIPARSSRPRPSKSAPNRRPQLLPSDRRVDRRADDARVVHRRLYQPQVARAREQRSSKRVSQRVRASARDLPLREPLTESPLRVPHRDSHGAREKHRPVRAPRHERLRAVRLAASVYLLVAASETQMLEPPTIASLDLHTGVQREPVDLRAQRSGQCRSATPCSITSVRVLNSE